MNRWLKYLVGAFFSTLMAFSADYSLASAQVQRRPPDKRLVSSWLGVVDGEAQTRTLTIVAIRPGPAGTLVTDAGFGITGGEILPVRCTVTDNSEGTKLVVTSFYGERIEAQEVNDGWFVGTYTYKDGRTTSITMGRIWQEDLPKNKFTVTANAKILLLYFGAEDCPYSAYWEKNGKAAFLHSKERDSVDFRIIKRKIHNRVPLVEDFPEDLRWLYDDAEAGGVSPYFVVVVGKTVVLRTYGLENWDRKVTPLLKELTSRQKIARSPRSAE